MSDKYTFIEFVNACESDDFDNPDERLDDWSNKFVESMPNVLKTEHHRGDCTNEPASCTICVFETMLRDYREYCKNPDEWRKENEI